MRYESGAPRRVLLATFGTLGDVHPFIAVALALRQRGLAPVLMTSAMHRDTVERAGVAFAPMRPDEPDIAGALGLDVAGVLRRMRRDPHFILDEIYLRFLAATYADVAAAAVLDRLFRSSTAARRADPARITAAEDGAAIFAELIVARLVARKGVARADRWTGVQVPQDVSRAGSGRCRH